jgi:hypothetical protein
MRLIQKKIENCSDAEIKEFGETVLNLDFSNCASRAQILGVLGPTWQPDFIHIQAADLGPEDQDDEASPMALQEVTAFNQFPDPRWLIQINSTAHIGGEEPVAVGVNGDVAVIQRDMPVRVPHRFVMALRNAVTESITQNTTTQKFKSTFFTKYPFEPLERPSNAEIREFTEKTKRNTLGGGSMQDSMAA